MEFSTVAEPPEVSIGRGLSLPAQWSRKTFFRFKCQETESAYQQQRIPLIVGSAGNILLFKALMTVPHVFLAVAGVQTTLPIWNVGFLTVSTLLAVAVGLLLILGKDCARRNWTAVKTVLGLAMVLDVGRLLLAQCIRTAAAPDIEA